MPLAASVFMWTEASKVFAHSVHNRCVALSLPPSEKEGFAS